MWPTDILFTVIFGALDFNENVVRKLPFAASLQDAALDMILGPPQTASEVPLHPRAD